MNLLRYVLFGVLGATLASGCAVTFTPEPVDARPSAVGVVSPSDRVINPYLGIRGFPGSRIVTTEFDGRDSETLFEADASLADVYDYFHRQLVAAGWRRVELEVESDEIEAEYVRAGVELELELEREGRGLFELELDVD
jgi:hypothetical protein